MSRAGLVVLLVAACGTDDASSPRLVTLTAEMATRNSAIVGNGLDCGVGSACDGTMATECSTMLEVGTHVLLHVVYPVCPETPAYTSFLWTSPPCSATPAYTCEFDITRDEHVRALGGTTAR